jgi:hypothetical protein
MIDHVGELEESGLIWRTRSLDPPRRDHAVGNRYDRQTDFIHSTEVGKAIQARQQGRNQKTQSRRPCGAVDMDSEELIAYVRDSTFWCDFLREQGSQLAGPCVLLRRAAQ